MGRRNYGVSGDKKRQRTEKNLSISYRMAQEKGLYVCYFKKLSARHSLVVQWLAFCALLPRVQVQPQGRELRSTKLHGQNKSKTK